MREEGLGTKKGAKKCPLNLLIIKIPLYYDTGLLSSFNFSIDLRRMAGNPLSL